MPRAIYVTDDTEAARSAILAAIPSASVLLLGNEVHTVADDVSAVHALAAAQLWATPAGAAEGLLWGVAEKTPVAHTIRDANGRALVPPTTDLQLLPIALLPVTTISRTYRGLLVDETVWRLEDLEAGALPTPNRGQPKSGAVPVCRLVTSWEMDADAGPINRPVTAYFYATDGTVILRVPWTPKPYGVPLVEAPNGQVSSQDAGTVRRRNVVIEIRRHGEAAIPLWRYAEAAAGRTPPASDACAGALIGLVAQYETAYVNGDPTGITAAINGAITTATLTPTGSLGWLLHSITVARPGGNVADSCGDHMLDALVDPSL